MPADDRHRRRMGSRRRHAPAAAVSSHGAAVSRRAHRFATAIHGAGRDRRRPSTIADRVSRTASRTSLSCTASAPASSIAAHLPSSMAAHQLQGGEVTASDLRPSAALVLAGLAADGCTTIRQAHHLYRGYDRLIEKLQSLGANVALHAELPISEPHVLEAGSLLLLPARNFIPARRSSGAIRRGDFEKIPLVVSHCGLAPDEVCRCGSVFSR